MSFQGGREVFSRVERRERVERPGAAGKGREALSTATGDGTPGPVPCPEHEFPPWLLTPVGELPGNREAGRGRPCSVLFLEAPEGGVI